MQSYVKVGGKHDLHCGGPGENVNAGCQPPLHDRPGKRDRTVGSVDVKQRGQTWKERKEKLNTSHQLLINYSMTEPFIMVLEKDWKVKIR